MTMERPKVPLKNVWAIKELMDDQEIKTLEVEIAESSRPTMATMLKKAYLLGLNSGLQRCASALNEKELYELANKVLKIGEEEV